MNFDDNVGKGDSSWPVKKELGNFEEIKKQLGILKSKLLKIVDDDVDNAVSQSGSGMNQKAKEIRQWSPNDDDESSNPYSRLIALKRMGRVPNYEEIRKLTVMIVGIGGVGAVSTEMLVRCGVGKVILLDYDKVEMANMNRLFFRPENVGSFKVNAAKEILAKINPDVTIETHAWDVTVPSNYDRFVKTIQFGSIDKLSSVDLVLSCVDNYAARMSINQACTELDQPWMESGVSEDALSGHIQFMLPGRTACFACVPPYLVATDTDEATLKRDGVCVASLPTTMSIIAGMLVQNSLKHMLGFGIPSYCQQYQSLTNWFPSSVLYPNPDCTFPTCLERQKQYFGHWKPCDTLPQNTDTNAEASETENASLINPSQTEIELVAVGNDDLNFNDTPNALDTSKQISAQDVLELPSLGQQSDLNVEDDLKKPDERTEPSTIQPIDQPSAQCNGTGNSEKAEVEELLDVLQHEQTFDDYETPGDNWNFDI